MTNPAPDFDRLARPYRWLEAATFGPLLMHTRCAFLPRLAACRRALLLGDGDGRFTRRLLDLNSAVRIDAVDASPAMLAALQRRAGPHRARVQTHHADLRAWQPPPAGYDLVVTHFFLDCLTTPEVQSLAARIRPACAPGALWVVSDFRIPRGPVGALLARPLVALLYRAFGLLTGLRVLQLPRHRAALAAAGFTLLRHRPRLAGILSSELWQTTENPQKS